GLFFSSRRRHTRFSRDWSSDVCSSDLRHPLRRPTLRRRSIRVVRSRQSRTSSTPRKRSTKKRARTESCGPFLYRGVLVAAACRRSEERRVGEEWWSRWWRTHYRKE